MGLELRYNIAMIASTSPYDHNCNAIQNNNAYVLHKDIDGIIANTQPHGSDCNATLRLSF